MKSRNICVSQWGTLLVPSAETRELLTNKATPMTKNIWPNMLTVLRLSKFVKRNSFDVFRLKIGLHSQTL